MTTVTPTASRSQSLSSNRATSKERKSNLALLTPATVVTNKLGLARVTTVSKSGTIPITESSNTGGQRENSSRNKSSSSSSSSSQGQNQLPAGKGKGTVNRNAGSGTGSGAGGDQPPDDKDGSDEKDKRQSKKKKVEKWKKTKEFKSPKTYKDFNKNLKEF